MKFDWHWRKTKAWECRLEHEVYMIEPVDELGWYNSSGAQWRAHCTRLPYEINDLGYLPKDLRGLVSWDCAAIFSSLEDAKRHCEHHYRTLVLQ